MPEATATMMAGHRPNTMSAASTGTNDSVTWPITGRRTSRRSVTVDRAMKATRPPASS